MKKNDTVAIVGLGYVGLPLAVAFSSKARVIGFDTNPKKVELYRQGYDLTFEVGDEAIQNSSIEFTSDPSMLSEASFIIVAVPTPIDDHRNPDLRQIRAASKIVGQNLSHNAIVVYESTVYPGVTEDECVPILEKESGLVCGVDFKVGYSPERINPGDKVHRLENIVKIVAGIDEEALEHIAKTYELVVEAGVYRAPSIKVAEAAKVIENSQRDINIAFINELSKIFGKMGIDTLEVLKAASTKWNFLDFKPGLVGGHCIGVDPYYLTYKAQELGYLPEVILAGRRINDSMGKHVAENVVKLLIKDGCNVKNAKVLVMGVTFKEDIPDVRNSKVFDIIQELQEYSVEVFAIDPYADSDEVSREYGFRLSTQPPLVDAVILAVSHKEYLKMTLDEIQAKLAPSSHVFADVKGIFDRKAALGAGLRYWRL